MRSARALRPTSTGVRVRVGVRVKVGVRVRVGVGVGVGVRVSHVERTRAVRIECVEGRLANRLVVCKLIR